MTNREDAVSGAIAGVLLIALVLVGAAIVGTYVMSQPLPERIPKVQFDVKVSNETNLLILKHEGGESLDSEDFRVRVDGALLDPGTPGCRIEPDAGRWSIGDRIVITNHANAQSVGLVYADASGGTLLRSVSSPWGFEYVLPSYDPSERVTLPPPKSWGIYTPWDPTKPGTWPSVITIIAPSGDTVDFDSTKVAYVAAHDTKILPPDSRIVPQGLAVPPTVPLFVCDGIDDDREINDALSMVRGGTVILLDGSFHCSDRIRVPGCTRLIGQGSTVTKVEVLAKTGGSGYLPVTLDQPDVTIEGFSLWGNGFVMVTTSHVRVRDIVATSWDLGDSPAMHRASGNGMFFVWATTQNLQDIEFYNCKAIDCHTHGFNMNQQWDIGGSDSQARTIGWVRFVGCQALRCGFGEPAGSRSEWITGFDLHEWQDLRHVWVLDCWAQDNWESGFHLEPGGRYDENGEIIGARTISEDINFVNCTSRDNGWRNTYAGAFFMSGYYLSRNTTMENCHSINNRNAGFYVHGGENCLFENCDDDSSTYGWKVCKASSDISISHCTSLNTFGNTRWALWLSFSQRVTVEDFEQHNVAGDRGYQNILGWYKDEAKYQQPVTDSSFDITAYGNGLPIINQAGGGNTYSLTYA